MNRIRLRRLLDADFKQVLELVQDPDVMRYLGNQQPLTHKEAVAWFNEEITLTTRFAIALADSDEFIGICGIKSKGELHDFNCFVRRAYWQKGYATEACHAFIAMANVIPEINEMEIFIANENHASQHLAKKLGYVAFSPSHSDRGDGHLYRLNLAEHP